MKIAVIGAGASGLFVAGLLAGKGHDVTVFDKNEKVGKKLYITGKGRCNLTNLCAPDEFLKNVVRGEKFLRSAIYNFSSQDAVDFFEGLGLATKVERGNRVFPQSDKASDVIKVLQKVHCKNVNFRLGEEVLDVKWLEREKKEEEMSFRPNGESGGISISQGDCSGQSPCPAEILHCVQDDKAKDGLDGENENEIAKTKTWTSGDFSHARNDREEKTFLVKTGKGEEKFDRVIVATGGRSYRSTGSDGKGYEIAKKFGHKIVPLAPALCPIRLKNRFEKSLQGISLKNVTLCALADGKTMSFFGEMLFTDDGISGPIVLSMSSFLNRAKKVELWLDFKPALTEKQLDARLLRDFEVAKNKDILWILRGLLPKSMAEVFEETLEFSGRKVNSITKEERAKIVSLLKHFPLLFGGLYDLDAGIVTSGGVDLGEINPKTFESKLQSGLYFLGEVLDVDALTGGFNLQIAWASAFMCAKNFE